MESLLQDKTLREYHFDMNVDDDYDSDRYSIVCSEMDRDEDNHSITTNEDNFLQDDKELETFNTLDENVNNSSSNVKDSRSALGNFLSWNTTCVENTDSVISLADIMSEQEVETKERKKREDEQKKKRDEQKRNNQKCETKEEISISIRNILRLLPHRVL